MRDRVRENQEERDLASLVKVAVAGENGRSARKVIHELSQLAKVGGATIIGESRSQHIVRLRHIAIYAVHSICGLSSTQIGDIFCRDHSTILYALKRSKKLMDENPSLAELYNQIWEKFS